MNRQIITFEVTRNLLAVDIMAIREIRAWTDTTPLPQSPSYVLGVVNLRGTVLPVVDLSDRLGWSQTEQRGRNVIIVLEIAGQLNGLVVDAVHDIVSIENSEIQPMPNTGATAANKMLEGLVTIEDRMAMILDLSRLSLDIVGEDLIEAA